MNQQTQTSQDTSQDILYELRDGIGRITFNRPQARNAFTFAMYERLAQICDEADRDRAIKVLVLQGAGDKAFASGTDINQFRAFTTPQHALEYESRIDRVLTSSNSAGCRPSRRSPAPAPAAAPASPPAAICASAPKLRAWGFRSRERSAIVCRCRASAG